MAGRARRRLRVALDVDDTVADISRVVLRKVNRELGTDYVFESIWGTWNSDKVLWDTYARFYEELWTKKHKTIRLFVDKRLLRQLARHYDISFVSARGWSRASAQGLADWLKHHKLENIPVEITNTSDDKARLGYDVYIDDYHVKVKGKRMLLLIDYGHNRHIRESRNVTRVRGVNDAIRLLIKRAGNGY